MSTEAEAVDYRVELPLPVVVQDLKDGGRVTYTFAAQGKQTVIAEITIHRAEGIHPRHLRSLDRSAATFRFEQVLREQLDLSRLDTLLAGYEVVAQAVGGSGEPWSQLRHPLKRATQQLGEFDEVLAWWREIPPGKDGRDRRLAATAKLYIKALQQGEQAPNQFVAAAQNRSMPAVREDLRAARKKGLLSSVGRGRAGGVLDEKAVALLGKVSNRG